MADQEEITEVVNTPVEQTSESTPIVETPSEEASEETDPVAQAAAAGEAEKETVEEVGDDGNGEEPDDEEVAGYKPQLKFKAGFFNKDSKQLEQKEHEIDKKFHGIMKDPESERLVRELHEKAYGLDSVKQRFELTKQENIDLSQRNQQMTHGISELRGIYQGAVKSGNLHKLDQFFEKLQIPQEHILKYALAKIELADMPEAQRNALMGQLQEERKANELAQQREQLTSQTMTQQQEIKTLQLQHTLDRVEVAPMVKAFDDRVGKPGSFEELVRREGEYAFLREGVDLHPSEAVQRVIKNFGLTQGAPAATAPVQPPAQANTPASPGTTTIVKRTAPTIPNVNGRSASPLPSKPKSMDDLLKYRKEAHGF